MPQISIITPVYNVEKYLPRCIESILEQTFTDFELILINDGSKDNSGHLCDEYSAKDARIRAFHQENQGQAVARNNALDIANGEYISFIDSDDYVHPRYLEILYNNIKESNASVSVCSYIRTASSNVFEDLTGETYVYNGKEYVQKGLLGEIQCGVWLLWDKLFRKACWDNVRLPVGRINEDNATVYKILYEAETVVACNDVLYCYFENQNSTVLQKFKRKHLDWLLVSQEMIEYFTEKKDTMLIDKSNRMYLDSLADMLKKVRANLSDKALEKELRTKLIKQYKSEKKKYPITLKTHPALFETLYPRRMKLYWMIKGITNKFKR